MTHKELASLIGTTKNGVEIISREKNSYGKYVYIVRYNGETLTRMRDAVANMIEGKVTRATVIPKSQGVEVTASNKDRVRTYRFSSKKTSAKLTEEEVQNLQAIAYRRVDDLRCMIDRLEREIDLTLSFVRTESFETEYKLLAAAENERAEAKKRAEKRVAILENYIAKYDSKIVEAMKIDFQKAQLMLLQKDERIERATALIASLK